jgi:hypothetical protein
MATHQQRTALVERELRIMLDNAQHLQSEFNISVTAQRIVNHWESDYLSGINTTLRDVNARIRDAQQRYGREARPA